MDDRERLKEVHQTDLTESRVNEDFVDWLKDKGPTWLLVILVALVAFLGIDRFRSGKVQKRSAAWSALAAAQLPGSLEDVASEYSAVGAIAQIAQLRAADEVLLALQRGRTIGAATPDAATTPPGATPPADGNPLTADDRSQYITRAERLYQAVLDGDTGASEMTLFAANALNGLAALAEAQGDMESARSWYTKAAERTASEYAGLASLAGRRAASLVDGATEGPTAFPTELERRAAKPAPEPRKATPFDPALRELIFPEESTANASDG